MTKLAQLPDEATIIGLRGVLDFAITRGVPYARRWPRKAQPAAGTGSWTTATELGDFATRIKLLATPLYEASLEASRGANQTWRDTYMQALYGNLNRTL